MQVRRCMGKQRSVVGGAALYVALLALSYLATAMSYTLPSGKECIPPGSDDAASNMHGELPHLGSTCRSQPCGKPRRLTATLSR